MHGIGMILKGIGLFVFTLIAASVGTGSAKPKKVRAEVKKTLAPGLVEPAIGAMGVVAWVVWIKNGWIALGICAVGGFLVGYAAEWLSWALRSEESRNAWLTKTREELEAQSQRADEKKKLDDEARKEAEKRLNADRGVWLDRLFELEKSGNERVSLNLNVPVHLSTGAAAYGKKVLAGMLTQGRGAVFADKFNLNSVVAIPTSCGLCGLFPGTNDRVATADFRRGSKLSQLTGVNLDAAVSLNYKVCHFCARRHEEPIRIDKFEKAGEEWHLALSVLNPEVAKRIAEMNVVLPRQE